MRERKYIKIERYIGEKKRERERKREREIERVGMNYKTEITDFRYAIFRSNMKKVQFLQETEQGTATYGATHLADLTPGMNGLATKY